MYSFDYHVQYLVKRQETDRKLEAELRMLEPALKDISFEKLGIRYDSIHLQVKKEQLSEIRKAGLNWNRGKVEMAYVTDAERHEVMMTVPLSDCIHLDWVEVYEPKPEDKCQWVQRTNDPVVLPSETYTNLECNREVSES